MGFYIIGWCCICENMTSNIRIVQSALRAVGKTKMIQIKKKNHFANLYKDDWLENNENLDLKKVKEVIYQMGLEDETISQASAWN